MEPAKVIEVTDEQYHADPCDTPSLSQSLAHILVTQSPEHAWLRHPRLGGVPTKPTKAMDKGTLIHALLLGTGEDQIVVADADDWRTKAAQAARDEARADGLCPVLKREYDDAKDAEAALRPRLARLGVDLDGEGDNEVAVTWTEHVGGKPVVCRGKFDRLRTEGVIYELKTTRSANPQAVARSFHNYGYDLQWRAYTNALAKLRPDLEGTGEMIFAFMEIEPPYAVLACQPDGIFRELGERRWKRALEIWQRCIETNEWPGYADRVVPLNAPGWALSQEEIDGDRE